MRRQFLALLGMTAAAQTVTTRPPRRPDGPSDGQPRSPYADELQQAVAALQDEIDQLKVALALDGPAVSWFDLQERVSTAEMKARVVSYYASRV